MLIKSFCLEKSLIFIKKILNRLFQDLSINLELKNSKNRNLKNTLLVVYPDNFTLFSSKFCKKNLKRNRQKNLQKTFKLTKKSFFSITKLLYLVSAFGEILTLVHILNIASLNPTTFNTENLRKDYIKR